MRKPTGAILIEWYDELGHKVGSCERNSYIIGKKIADLWESKHLGNSVVISHILYNTYRNGNKWEYKSMLFENFYAALYTQAAGRGEINPPGELKYKGYSRQLFCSLNGTAIEDITFSKSEENCLNCATHLVIMTHKGRVMYSNLLTHNKP